MGVVDVQVHPRGRVLVQGHDMVKSMILVQGHEDVPDSRLTWWLTSGPFSKKGEK